jgi:hypothetical protein|tara:strand:- start:127 stop:285 length:159 start_codon:yes stop_codon:yes gene_type:complete
MKKFFLILLFLSSCSSNEIVDRYNFSDNMTFDEFKIKLENYAINNPYPQIDD